MNIPEFVRESNRIEGIHRDPTEAEISALDDFIQLPTIRIVDLQTFVSINQPGAVLRDREGLDVRVGKHFPPPGGTNIVRELGALLESIGERTPYENHVLYETLHPFTDGNGRSGRALWAWDMWQRGISMRLGFLHTWYYQSLQASSG